MSAWEEEIDIEVKEQKKRWNGKVITTSKQWLYNDCGSKEVHDYSMISVWDAVRDYYSSRDWN